MDKKQFFRELNTEDIQCPKSQQDFATDVLMGLSLFPKRLPCKYIYDDRGSKIFKKITELPEYYLTSAEMEILEKYKEEIVNIIGNRSVRLVELGAGDCQKAKIIIREMSEKKIDFTFNPIDISQSAIKNLTRDLKKEIPTINIEGLVSEYFTGLKWLANFEERVNIVLFLGSNIGNFELQEVDVFLSNLWNACNHGDFILIGFDLKKDINLMLNAYNDSQGITAQFNMNLLHRINRELGGHFDPEQFEYFSTFDVIDGAIKSYLISLKDQSVFIDMLNRQFSFTSWDPIHTESSFKYQEKDIKNLSRKNGFILIKNFFDSRDHFVDSIWRVQKDQII